MKDRLSFILFWIRYQVNNLVLKVTGRKPKRYLLVLMGRYPSNLNTVLKGVVAPDTDFRFSIGPNCIVAILHSKKAFRELDEYLLTTLQGHADNILLIRMTNLTREFYNLNMTLGMYRNLFGRVPPDTPKSPYARLDQMQAVINLVNLSRNQMNLFMQEITKEINEFNQEALDLQYPVTDAPKETEPTAEEIEIEVNAILLKIREKGYDALSEAEKAKLLKYGTNL